jgi:hypothetical protein
MEENTYDIPVTIDTTPDPVEQPAVKTRKRKFSAGNELRPTEPRPRSVCLHCGAASDDPGVFISVDCDSCGLPICNVCDQKEEACPRV